MANPAVEAALQSALANQQFDSVAPILDAAELEVHITHPYQTMYSSRAMCRGLTLLLDVPLQSSNPDVLNQWPHTLHLLGLMYNQQL